jgi:hypothetical protein
MPHLPDGRFMTRQNSAAISGFWQYAVMAYLLTVQCSHGVRSIPVGTIAPLAI